MCEKALITVEPGTVDYENRDYLPASLMGSHVLISDNGNDSIVYPAGLKKREEVLLPGAPSVWYEYAPARLAPRERRTLIVSLHGGLMEGWGQAVYSSWVKVAQREGYVAAFPNASSRRFWTIEYDPAKEEELTAPNDFGVYLNKAPRDIRENRDANMLLALIERLTGEYDIPRERVLIHGMSMGDMMASMMGRYYGGRFLGVASSGALALKEVLFNAQGEPRNQGGPTRVMQTHMELDDLVAGTQEPTGQVVRQNREYWLRVNGCEGVPRISIVGENNIAWYRGKADYFFREVKNRDHGQTLDEAEIVNELFLGETSGGAREVDRASVALSVGRDRAYVNGEVLSMAGAVFEQHKYAMGTPEKLDRAALMMAPVKDLCRWLGGEVIEERPDSVSIRLADGRRAQFAAGNTACVVENRVNAMPVECVEKQNILYVPVEWFCQQLLPLRLSRSGDTVYITDHHAQLSKNMAALIEDLLK